MTLPQSGSANPVTATAASASAIFGPAVIFSSGQLTVSTHGATGPGGSVTSSTDITSVNTSDQEVFTASRVQSTCTASETGVSGSVTLTNGSLRTDSGDANPANTTPDHPEVTVPLPANPAPNTVVEGHIHIGNVTDSWRYVVNEQIMNSDGSITVNAAHQYLLGPSAVGELILGQSVCGQSTAPLTAQFTSPTPGQTDVTNSTPFTWTAAPGADAFILYVGTTQGASDVYISPDLLPGTQFSASPTLLGSSTLWTRIWTLRGGAWTFSDVNFTTGSLA